MSVLIQEMTVQDYDKVRALWQESEGIELSEVDSKDDIARFLERDPGLSFVARDNGQLVGVALCSHDGRRGYIDQLAVCHLFVLEDNQDAIAFWKKLGWAERVELVTMSHHHVNGA
jgi:ribosomal protein S18 acetylase RimI-like enzyme